MLIVPLSQFQLVPVCFLINFLHTVKSVFNLSHLFLSWDFFQHDTSTLKKPIIHLFIAHIIRMSVGSISLSNLLSEQLANKCGMLIIPRHLITLFMILHNIVEICYEITCMKF